MNEQINIKITDMNDVNKVLDTTEHLLKTILLYYIDTNQMKKAKRVIFNMFIYFGNLLKSFINIEDVDDGNIK